MGTFLLNSYKNQWNRESKQGLSQRNNNTDHKAENRQRQLTWVLDAAYHKLKPNISKQLKLNALYSLNAEQDH